MFRLLLSICILAGCLSACSSGQTAFRYGHYDLAVQKASVRLREPRGPFKRGHRLAHIIIREAFMRAYNQHQTAIRQLSSAPPDPANRFRWEPVFQRYTQLQLLTDNARSGSPHQCDSCAAWLATYPVSYATQQNEVRQLAASDRYQAAEVAFAERFRDRLAAKEAYLNYNKATDWVPNYSDSRDKSAQALPFAILRVVVDPIGPTHEIDADDNRELEGLIFRNIERNPTPSTFVRLYLPHQSVDTDFNVHQVVQMKVTDYSSFNETVSSSSTKVYSNQTYKVGEKKINDSTKVAIMEKVSGTLTTHRREIKAGLDLRMRAINTFTDKVVWEETVWETRTWVTEWETFSGDDRALNGNSLKTADLHPPSRWQLYSSMRDELADDVARRLRSRYAKE